MKAQLIALALAGVGITSSAQEVVVTISVSNTASNQIAELCSNGIPMDYVINAGYAQSVARIKSQMTLQINSMNAEQLLLAYPKFTPLVDTNDPVAISESILRPNAQNEVRRLKTISAAKVAYTNQEAIIKAHPQAVAEVPDRFKLQVDANGVARIGTTIVSTNAPMDK